MHISFNQNDNFICKSFNWQTTLKTLSAICVLPIVTLLKTLPTNLFENHYFSFMKKRMQNDNAVSITLPVIPDAPQHIVVRDGLAES